MAVSKNISVTPMPGYILIEIDEPTKTKGGIELPASAAAKEPRYIVYDKGPSSLPIENGDEIVCANALGNFERGGRKIIAVKEEDVIGKVVTKKE